MALHARCTLNSQIMPLSAAVASPAAHLARSLHSSAQTARPRKMRSLCAHFEPAWTQTGVTKPRATRTRLVISMPSDQHETRPKHPAFRPRSGFLGGLGRRRTWPAGGMPVSCPAQLAHARSLSMVIHRVPCLPPAVPPDEAVSRCQTKRRRASSAKARESPITTA